jgi:large subunit ribosomal protein L32
LRRVSNGKGLTPAFCCRPVEPRRANTETVAESLMAQLHSGVPMAVPKKKTSKARRDKRRAQHKIESPRLNVCPQCGRPKRPHRVCPTCHTYRGRDVEPLRTPAP